MKTVFTFLGLLIATVTFSQAQNLEGKVTTENIKITNLSVSVTVDSAEEVKTTFDMKDIKSILNEVEGDEEISFEITCNGEKISEGVTKKVSYRVTGNSNDKDAFLKRINKIRKAAITYYNNKE
ncbi:hypothetical protein ES692_08800 [Psychroserpens burtonensis]|jgi:hypothetical protein|uniref:Uncharacterized protein n=1 Tax=Psychroserpens burtonensis TaxID=49278 RepID=A0A5C7B928_9FLAO|nr:hypothetical protein [Psychroserpens burtonensis]TXE17653.1 hypothetical protein ES692_08800 [Psychroserpens burtonensis]